MRLWLSSLRKAKGYSQQEMADRLSISKSSYISIEHGRRQRDITLAFTDRLAKALEVPFDLVKEMELKYDAEKTVCYEQESS